MWIYIILIRIRINEIWEKTDLDPNFFFLTIFFKCIKMKNKNFNDKLENLKPEGFVSRFRERTDWSNLRVRKRK